MADVAVVDASPLIYLTARPVLERLREAGMYLSDAILDRALAMAGE